MLDGLAFLPVNDVKAGMSFLQEQTPDHLRGLVDYFDATYVNGGLQPVRNKENGNIRFRRTLPLFAPAVWNVHEATIHQRDRTNNKSVGGNNGFKSLVGQETPSLWTVVDNIQKRSHVVGIDILKFNKGKLRAPKVNKRTKKHKQKLKEMCDQYATGGVTVPQFLNQIGKCIRINKKKQNKIKKNN